MPERVPILATLVLLDANRQAPRSVHLMRPSPFVMPPWRARPAAISGKVAMRIFRTTRTRLSLKCCAHDTAPRGMLASSVRARRVAQKMHGIGAEFVGRVGCRATLLRCGEQPKKPANCEPAVTLLVFATYSDPAPTLGHRLPQGPACARRAPAAGRSLPIAVLVRVPHQQADRSPFTGCNIALARAALTLPLGSMRPLG